jgi:hypothetical protein
LFKTLNIVDEENLELGKTSYEINQTKDLINFQEDVFRTDSTKGSSTFQNKNLRENKQNNCYQNTNDESLQSSFKNDLIDFNQWNYIFSGRALKGISRNLEKSSFERRSSSAPVKKRYYDVEYHPQISTMLHKWKKKFNKSKNTQNRKLNKFKKRALSNAKLAFIKKHKNDELSILDMCPLVKRNLCKDDIFLPKESEHKENTNTLVIKLSLNKNKSKTKRNRELSTPLAVENEDLLKTNAFQNIHNYQDYSKYFESRSSKQNFKSFERLKKKKSKINKLLELFSICSKKKEAIKNLKKQERITKTEELEQLTVTKIRYEFGIQKIQNELKLNLLRVNFKDADGRFVML